MPQPTPFPESLSPRWMPMMIISGKDLMHIETGHFPLLLLTQHRAGVHRIRMVVTAWRTRKHFTNMTTCLVIHQSFSRAYSAHSRRCATRSLNFSLTVLPLLAILSAGSQTGSGDSSQRNRRRVPVAERREMGNRHITKGGLRPVLTGMCHLRSNARRHGCTLFTLSWCLTSLILRRLPQEMYPGTLI